MTTKGMCKPRLNTATAKKKAAREDVFRLLGKMQIWSVYEKILLIQYCFFRWDMALRSHRRMAL